MNLTDNHVDALKELINIGVGRAAGVLNQMVRSHIILQVPAVKVLRAAQLAEELAEFGEEGLAVVSLDFQGAFSGVAELLFPLESASNLVARLTGEEVGSPDLDSVRAGTLSEVGNIILNGVMGSIVNVLKQRLEFGLTSYEERTIKDLLHLRGRDPSLKVLVARARFAVDQQDIDGDIIVLFETGAFDRLLEAIDAMHALAEPGL